MMKIALLLAIVWASCVSGDLSQHQHPPASSSSSSTSPSSPASPQTPPAQQHHQATVQAQTQAPVAPANAYADSHQDAYQQGNYYYYYPVQEQQQQQQVQQQKTKGLFDFSRDGDMITAIIVGVLFVGGLLVALSYVEIPTESRTLDSLNLPYHEIYDMAFQVYQAISKKY